LSAKLGVDPKTGLVNAVHYIDLRSKRVVHGAGKGAAAGASTLDIDPAAVEQQEPAVSRWARKLERGAWPWHLFDQFYVKNTVTALVPEGAGRQRTTESDGLGPWRRAALYELEARQAGEELFAGLGLGLRQRGNALTGPVSAVGRGVGADHGRCPGRWLRHDHHGRESAAV
jgi:hypothetical protein